MCNPISWIEKDGQLLYLTGADLETKRGRMLLKHTTRDDLCGHGAIRYFFGTEKDDGTIELMSGGEEKEVNGLTPDHLPEEISSSLINGLFRGVWYGVTGLLNDKAFADYEAKRDTLFWDMFMIVDNRSDCWKI